MAVCLSSMAFFTSPEMRAVDWSMEYSEWAWRWTKAVSIPLLHDPERLHLIQQVFVAVPRIGLDADQFDGILVFDEQQGLEGDAPELRGGITELDGLFLDDRGLKGFDARREFLLARGLAVLVLHGIGRGPQGTGGFPVSGRSVFR